MAVDLTTVPHSRPYLGEAEAEAAREVVLSGRLALGERGAELERRFAALSGAADAACTGSGVAALRLGLHALGVGPGDEVIVPAYSCVALLNPVLSLGATPMLADVDRDTWTLSVDAAAALVTPRTRAVVAVDLFGAPAPVEQLHAFGLPVVEDCAHGPYVARGDLAIASFYPTKLIAAGEGGIVAARDEDVLERVRVARDYADRLPSRLHLNDKLTDVEAAIALCQLDRLDEIVALRAERAARYTRELAPLAGRLVLPPDVPGRVWYRYAVRLLEHRAEDVCTALAEWGVLAARPVWDLRACPQWRPGLDRSAEAFERVLSLPLYPDLSDPEQARVCEALADCLGQ